MAKCFIQVVTPDRLDKLSSAKKRENSWKIPPHLHHHPPLERGLPIEF